ncbi:MAG TPA: mechanosensitive ion channel family protein [Ilumatobacteraceae bacterium]|nr:mechanosensitive ion channel family protein [Ilumatobacteraceae bacterium]
MLASIDTLDELTRWLRGDFLLSILLITGAVLFIRGARSLMSFATRRAEKGDANNDAKPPLGHRQRAVGQALGWVITAFVWLVVGVLVADRFGLPLATLVPTASIIGVAVGFGAQRIVLDLLSGFFLLTERQLSIGDLVRVSAPGTTTGVTGHVEEITLRATRLRTAEGDVVFISNGEIRQLTNLSADWSRVLIDVPLPPDGDVDKALSTLRQLCEDIREADDPDNTFLEGPDVLGVQRFDVGVIEVRVAARVPSDQQFQAARNLRQRIALALAEAGIELARPVVVSRGAR